MEEKRGRERERKKDGKKERKKKKKKESLLEWWLEICQFFSFTYHLHIPRFGQRLGVDHIRFRASLNHVPKKKMQSIRSHLVKP